MKDLITGIAVVGLIIVGLFAVTKETAVTQLGAVPSLEPTELMIAKGGLTYGEGCFATSTSGVLLPQDLKNGCIYATAAGAGQAVISFTLPASSTMTMIPKKGNCHEWFYDASDLTAATTTTFVKGTGHDVVGLDATGAGTGADVIDGNEFARMTSCRETNGDVVTFMQEYIHAD